MMKSKGIPHHSLTFMTSWTPGQARWVLSKLYACIKSTEKKGLNSWNPWFTEMDLKVISHFAWQVLVGCWVNVKFCRLSIRILFSNVCNKCTYVFVKAWEFIYTRLFFFPVFLHDKNVYLKNNTCKYLSRWYLIRSWCNTYIIFYHRILSCFTFALSYATQTLKPYGFPFFLN